MKKIIMLSLVSLVLVSCGDKDAKIEFSSEYKKAEFCYDNIDNSNCSFYRPLLVFLFDKLEKKSQYGLKDEYMNTDAMSRYRFTKQYEKELKNVNSICDTGKDERCIALKSFLLGMIDL